MACHSTQQLRNAQPCSKDTIEARFSGKTALLHPLQLCHNVAQGKCLAGCCDTFLGCTILPLQLVCWNPKTHQLLKEVPFTPAIGATVSRQWKCRCGIARRPHVAHLGTALRPVEELQELLSMHADSYRLSTCTMHIVGISCPGGIFVQA